MYQRPETIESPPPAAPRYRWRYLVFVLLLLDIAYVINAMDRQVFPALVPRIADDLGFTAGQAGFQTTIFTLGMGLAAIPAGLIADRIGRKNMILVGLVAFSAATVLQGLSQGFADMAVYRVIAGAGEGIQNAALYAAVGTYFARNRAMAVGTLNAGYGVGAFGGPILGNWIAATAGSWRVAMFAFALIGLIVLALVFFGVPRTIAEHGQRLSAAAADTAGDTGRSDGEGRLWNRNIVCCTVVTAVAGFAVFGWIGLYPTYLEKALGFTPANASFAAGVFGVGALASVPLGAIADRWDQRLFNMVGLIGIMAVGGVSFTVPLGLGAQLVLSCLMGLCVTGILYTNTNSLMQRSVPEGRVGAVVGVFVAGYYIPASAAGYFFATMQGSFGWATAGLVQMVLFPAIGVLAMAFVQRPRPARALR
jgi:MFS family permease